MDKSANSLRASDARVLGHFGEWLQGRLGPDGPVALISIPCPNFWCDVNIANTKDELPKHNDLLSEDRIAAILRLVKRKDSVSISVNSNLPAKAGLGASTASLVALMRAASNTELSPHRIAEICISVEGATDPLMHSNFDTLLWSSRKGQVLGNHCPPPKIEIVGGLWGKGEVTDPSDSRFPDVSDLAARWASAAASGDLVEISKIATTSAARTTGLRGPDNDPTDELAKELGALGWMRAHTGSARGLLYRPGSVHPAALDRLSQLGYTHLTQFVTGN